MNSEIYRQIAPIGRSDPRYKPAAYEFIIEALDYTMRNLKRSTRAGLEKHICGQELLEGVRQYALQEFGLLARTVLAAWGVHRTEDVGEIVFNLVDHQLLNKRESDSMDDFRGGYDFETVFEKEYEIPVSWDSASD